MNIHINLLDYAAELEKAGIARPHAEAIAQLQARAIKDLIDHELVTKDFLRAELVILKAELREEFRQDLHGLRGDLSSKIDGSETTLRREIDEIKLQLRALQSGGAIAAFALGTIVLLSRLIS